MGKNDYAVCPTCLSPEVQGQVWMDLNTEKVTDDAGGYCWCYSCDNRGLDGEFKYTEALRCTVDLIHLAVLHSVLMYQPMEG